MANLSRNPCGDTCVARAQQAAIGSRTNPSSRGSVLDRDHVGGEARVAVDHGALEAGIGELLAQEVLDGALKMGIEARVTGISC